MTGMALQPWRDVHSAGTWIAFRWAGKPFFVVHLHQRDANRPFDNRCPDDVPPVQDSPHRLTMLMRHCACSRVVLSSKLDIQPIPIIKTTPAILYIAFSNCCLLHVEGYVGQVVGHGNRICSVYRYGVAFRANHRCCRRRSGTPWRPTTTPLRPAPPESPATSAAACVPADARHRRQQEGECHRAQRSA
jgi:hypothetical protein